MSGDPDTPLWTFSLALYDRRGVADACLHLQDAVGADVNILLFLCWAATVRAAPLAEEEIQGAVRHTQQWRTEIVGPLRALRRRLRSAVRSVPGASHEAFRGRLREVELEAERIEQAILYACAPPVLPAPPDPETARRNAAVNLAAYLAVLGCQETAEIREKLAVLVSAGEGS